jgi:hypothetical protein
MAERQQIRPIIFIVSKKTVNSKSRSQTMPMVGETIEATDEYRPKDDEKHATSGTAGKAKLQIYTHPRIARSLTVSSHTTMPR